MQSRLGTKGAGNGKAFLPLAGGGSAPYVALHEYERWAAWF